MIEILIRVPDGHPATRAAIADLCVAVMTVDGTFRLHHVDDITHLGPGEVVNTPGDGKAISGETPIAAAVRATKRAVKGGDQ